MPRHGLGTPGPVPGGKRTMKGFTGTLARIPILNSVLTERTVVGLCSGLPGEIAIRREIDDVRNLERLQRILVLADVNVGDSLLLQPAISALDRAIPNAEIDYVCHHKTAPMLEPDPAIRRTFGFFRGGRELPEETLRAIRELVADEEYDLVLNFCPFLPRTHLASDRRVVIGSLPLIVRVLRAHGEGGVAALPWQAAELVHDILDRLPPGLAGPERVEAPVTSIYIDSDRARAMRFAYERTGVGSDGGVVFVNPDTSNHTTFLGVEFHAALCTKLLASPLVDGLILGRGYTYRDAEHEIMDRLTAEDAERVVLPPEVLTLEDFAALADRCSVYVGGDTGPLHLAAARKIDPGGSATFANRTAIVGVFKATDPRIYGYDSSRVGFIGTSQDAPSRSIESAPSCKNLTCSVQRITGACPAVVCEDGLDPAAVASVVVNELARARDAARAAAGAAGGQAAE